MLLLLWKTQSSIFLLPLGRVPFLRTWKRPPPFWPNQHIFGASELNCFLSEFLYKKSSHARIMTDSPTVEYNAWEHWYRFSALFVGLYKTQLNVFELLSLLYFLFFQNTVNFLNIRTPQKNCCKHSKIWTMWFYHRVMGPNDADGMANSVDPDQTAPLGTVWSGSALLAQAYLSENLGWLRYTINKSAKIIHKDALEFTYLTWE